MKRVFVTGLLQHINAIEWVSRHLSGEQQISVVSDWTRHFLSTDQEDKTLDEILLETFNAIELADVVLIITMKEKSGHTHPDGHEQGSEILGMHVAKALCTPRTSVLSFLVGFSPDEQEQLIVDRPTLAPGAIRHYTVLDELVRDIRAELARSQSLRHLEEIDSIVADVKGLLDSDEEEF